MRDRQINSRATFWHMQCYNWTQSIRVLCYTHWVTSPAAQGTSGNKMAFSTYKFQIFLPVFLSLKQRKYSLMFTLLNVTTPSCLWKLATIKIPTTTKSHQLWITVVRVMSSSESNSYNHYELHTVESQGGKPQPELPGFIWEMGSQPILC